LDVDGISGIEGITSLAEKLDKVSGVESINLTLEEVDFETVGMTIVLEGENIDLKEVIETVKQCGAALHSIDQIVAGKKIIETVEIRV
jgi:hypothetical protein